MIYRKRSFKYKSSFAPYINAYVGLKESLGIKTLRISGILRQLDHYCINQNIESPILSDKLVNQWLLTKKGENQGTRSSRVSCLRGFADYLSSVNVKVSWIARPNQCASGARYVPYIYNKEQVIRLFTEADKLQKPLRKSMFHIVFSAVIKVMYCCGLRISEVLALRNKDVDLDKGLITIEHAKFENCRRLPISESLCNVLNEYWNANQTLIGVDVKGFFFPTINGEQCSYTSVYEKFRIVLWRSGIPHQGKGKGPRLHDLRHTFAVHSLQKNIQAGKDMYVSLPILMSYLGHRNISATEYYLHFVAELFPEFLALADKVCATVLPEVTEYED